MVFRHFSIKPMTFSTCSVEEKEHRVLFLSLSLSSPELDREGQSRNQRYTKTRSQSSFKSPVKGISV
jgi:hypothetical protein